MAAGEPSPLPTIARPEAAVSNPRMPFAVQAALFSLFAAPAAVLIGVYAEHADRSVARHLRWLGDGTLYAGLLLGVAALVAMAWTGRRRVLGRAVIGIVLSGAVWAVDRHARSIVAGPAAYGPAGPDPKWLIGRWTRRYHSNGATVDEVLTLRADGSFRERFVTTFGSAFGDWTGKWTVDADQLVEDVDPADVAVGSRTGHHHWAVGPVRVSRLELIVVSLHDHATLRYFKLPTAPTPGKRPGA